MAEQLDPRQGRARVEHLMGQLYRPFQRSLILDAALLVATTVIAIWVAMATRRVELAGIVALVGAGIAILVSWHWMWDPGRRMALEVLTDHTIRESELWKRETGTNVPSTASGAAKWLRDHPDAPGSASMLARLGRFAEARAAARRAPIESDEDRLMLELLERQLDLFEGGRPDTTALHSRWQGLPGSETRDLRRWCIAILEGQQAIDDGQDGWSALTAARDDVSEVRARASSANMFRTIVVMHALFATIVWLTSAWVIGPL
jgi:hypothetical protein